MGVACVRASKWEHPLAIRVADARDELHSLKLDAPAGFDGVFKCPEIKSEFGVGNPVVRTPIIKPGWGVTQNNIHWGIYIRAAVDASGALTGVYAVAQARASHFLRAWPALQSGALEALNLEGPEPGYGLPETSENAE